MNSTDRQMLRYIKKTVALDGDIPTVEALQRNTSSARGRARKALRAFFQLIHKLDDDQGDFAALAYLSGYKSEEDARKAVRAVSTKAIDDLDEIELRARFARAYPSLADLLDVPDRVLRDLAPTLLTYKDSLKTLHDSIDQERSQTITHGDIKLSQLEQCAKELETILGNPNTSEENQAKTDTEAVSTRGSNVVV